ncbi:MAG: hypothetical protein E5Y32_18700 [Mesorhizobium sp.]|nr:MAG: hypothetical protein E5Y32_18700 [Mesorhizobium sp.]
MAHPALTHPEIKDPRGSVRHAGENDPLPVRQPLEGDARRNRQALPAIGNGNPAHRLIVFAHASRLEYREDARETRQELLYRQFNAFRKNCRECAPDRPNRIGDDAARILVVGITAADDCRET